MRIGSGVQSASEVFGKQQNNSKTYVAENEEFSQTSVKVYLKTDDMLFQVEMEQVFRFILNTQKSQQRIIL